jgi:transcriptional regulator of heat shock response
MSSNLENTIQVLISLEQALTEPDFICEVETLLNSNLEIFETGEQSIQCFEVFQQFSRILDRQLQNFIQETGAVEEEVFANCKALYQQDQSALTCFEYIIAAGDYNDFLEMMLTRRELLQWRAGDEESASKDE